MTIRKRVTNKQLQANRRNSLASTGPRTLSGKNRSARNATKHGILSAQVASANHSEHEDAQQFFKLLADLTEEFEPVGTLEGLLVEQIAVAYWRLARSLRSEARELAGATVHRDLTVKCERHPFRTGTHSPEKSSELLASAILESLHDMFSDELLSALGENFGKGVQEIATLCNLILKNNKHQAIGVAVIDPDLAEGIKHHLLAYIKAAIADAERAAEITGKIDDFLRADPPDGGALERIARYETSILRNLDRALVQLERLQLRRKGEIIPPPVKLHIGS